MVSYQDPFTYTLGLNLETANSDWSLKNSGSNMRLIVVNNNVGWSLNGDTSIHNIYDYSGITLGSSQYSQCYINFGGAFSRKGGCAVRCQGTVSSNCFLGAVDSGNWFLGYVSGGLFTQLSSNTGVYTSAGGPYKLRLEINESDNLSFYIDDLLIISYQDIGGRFPSNGNAGFGGVTLTDSDPQYVVLFDNFDGGDISSGQLVRRYFIIN